MCHGYEQLFVILHQLFCLKALDPIEIDRPLAAHLTFFQIPLEANGELWFELRNVDRRQAAECVFSESDKRKTT